MKKTGLTERIEVSMDKCKACKRCEVACIAAHHGITFKEALKSRNIFAPRVHVIKTDVFKSQVRCHQCNPAPCCQVCPTHAITQNGDGTIVTNEHLCAACKMCIAACPYGAISLENLEMPEDYVPSDVPAAIRQTAASCDMCRHWREENGKEITACMEACPAQCLTLVCSDGRVIHAPKPEKKAKAEAE